MFIYIMLFVPLISLLYILSRVNYKNFLYIQDVFEDSTISAEENTRVRLTLQQMTRSSTALKDHRWLTQIRYVLYNINDIYVKNTGLQASIIVLWISILVLSIYDFSQNQFQFVQEFHKIDIFNFHLGLDGLSIYFLLLIAIIMPISLLSNWIFVTKNQKPYLTTILLLSILLCLVFMSLDVILFYIFFESILIPLFMLIGLFGSKNRVRASFYLFLYTLLGSLFLLLSILTMFSIMSVTDFDALYKMNFNYYTQIILFSGIFIAFAVKTPTIFLNIWLLKAHVESPLSGSIILAAIVLKLSIYGIFRIVLPLLPRSYFNCTYFIYLIGVLTIIYASISTLRTIDLKELIAYSSVSHAAVYLMAVFSNTIKGIEGSILLGLAHGFVSSGLFICAGGVLYDRSSTRLISNYRGVAQIMPVFCIMFFILCLGNCGAPLTLNFVGEFLSLYGTVEKSPLLGALASSSIVFSAAYTIFMFNRIAFGGSYSKLFNVNIIDLNKREFIMLSILIYLTVILGIYPNVILDGIHYSVTTLIYDMPAAMWLLPLNNIGRRKFLSRLHDILQFYYNTYLYIIKIVNNTLSIIVHKIKFNFSIIKASLDTGYPSLKWGLGNPPKTHAYESLPTQSSFF